MKPPVNHDDLAGTTYLALQRLARSQKRPTAELLQLYVLESFLRRLVRSQHDERFVLKGGLLMAAFDLRRATRDVNLLALRTDNDPTAISRLIAEAASAEVADGVLFLPETITVETMRKENNPALLFGICLDDILANRRFRRKEPRTVARCVPVGFGNHVGIAWRVAPIL